MTNDGYVQRRLDRMANDALLEAQKAVNQVQADATLKGALGNSRVYLLYDEAVGKVLEAALRSMAVVAFRASGGTSDATAQLLEKAGFKFMDNIIAWLHNRYNKTNDAFGHIGPPINRLKDILYAIVGNAVDDFHNGMVGEEVLKQDPVVSIVNNIANSPGAVSQNAVGNLQTVQQQQSALVGAISNLLASEEFKKLSEQNGAAIQDLADVLRDELEKPNADSSKVTRWGQRLVQLVQQLGLHVAAAEIAKCIFGS